MLSIIVVVAKHSNWEHLTHYSRLALSRITEASVFDPVPPLILIFVSVFSTRYVGHVMGMDEHEAMEEASRNLQSEKFR